MAQEFTVTLKRIIKELNLETLYTKTNPEEILINSAEVNRPGLQMIGYYEYFDHRRIQVIGKSESAYLEKLENFDYIIDKFFASLPVAVVITRNLPIAEKLIPYAQKHGVPLLRTQDGTSAFMSALIAFLNLHLAPRITRHGVLVEVYGEGILLLGES
ncbi:MAG: HPr kinase/phosphorylase, partial [Clostridia bacterium]|nr:HPr kinase/phosphorylase [Clostridia bacterium]